MTLILSCITKGEDHIRGTLDRLALAGIPNQAIIVFHPGAATGQPEPQPLPHRETVVPATTTMGAAASGSAAGGMFGWLLGYGVLALPGAVLGGTIGAVAGAAIGAGRHAMVAELPAEVQHHYASRVVDDHVAILVKVEDFKRYETVLTIFLDTGCQHILTSRNDRTVAESDQLDVIAHHPALLAEALRPGRSASTPSV